jgi:hypothetical protein
MTLSELGGAQECGCATSRRVQTKAVTACVLGKQLRSTRRLPGRHGAGDWGLTKGASLQGRPSRRQRTPGLRYRPPLPGLAVNSTAPEDRGVGWRCLAIEMQEIEGVIDEPNPV